MIYSAYALLMGGALLLGIAVGAWTARREGPPPALVPPLMLLCSAVLVGLGLLFAIDIPLR